MNKSYKVFQNSFQNKIVCNPKTKFVKNLVIIVMAIRFNFSYTHNSKIVLLEMIISNINTFKLKLNLGINLLPPKKKNSKFSYFPNLKSCIKNFIKIEPINILKIRQLKNQVKILFQDFYKAQIVASFILNLHVNILVVNLHGRLQVRKNKMLLTQKQK